MLHSTRRPLTLPASTKFPLAGGYPFFQRIVLAIHAPPNRAGSYRTSPGVPNDEAENALQFGNAAYPSVHSARENLPQRLAVQSCLLGASGLRRNDSGAPPADVVALIGTLCARPPGVS